MGGIKSDPEFDKVFEDIAKDVRADKSVTPVSQGPVRVVHTGTEFDAKGKRKLTKLEIVDTRVKQPA